MNSTWMGAVGMMPLLAATLGLAQQSCTNGIRIEGTVTDPTGSSIVGVAVQTSDGQRTTTDSAGHYVLTCVPSSATTITATSDGFSQGTRRVTRQASGIAHINVELSIAAVTTEVDVSDDALSSDRGAGTRTLSTQDVQQLASDPDDFLRQLQALAATGGGIPGSAIVTVDGFQNRSVLPPKSSIASIRINPDMFSPEYEQAPYLGGRVEIVTKPGADSFHGALFFTDSDGSFNATNPFSVTATPAGKRRYGFELSGSVIPKKSAFALALEKRDIDEFNVINAVTLTPDGNQKPLQQTVSAPQRLWAASARTDLQLNGKDVATLSFTANVNSLGNQGIGGLTLADAGYSNLLSEYDLRFSNVMTLNANLLHESRIGYSWKRTQQTPLSSAPSLQVAGYFNGGGSTAQNLNDRERDLEVDDDLLLSRGKHELKFGAQALGMFVHDYDPNTFNGAYVFGGGSAPALDSSNKPAGQTTTILPIEQYRRALSKLPGGSPTTYQITTGIPLVSLTQWRLALYAQDALKLAPRLTLTTGLRYQLQTTPSSFANFSPRIGVSWSPDKKEKWVIHARAGLFHDPNVQQYATDVYRLDGVRQRQATVYSPSYSNPLTAVAGSVQVGTINDFPASLSQGSSLQTHISVERSLPAGWHAASTLYWAENWGSLRLVNINAPLVDSSTGILSNPITALLAPRPIAPNLNIEQYQNSGHLSGPIVVVSAGRSSGKRFDLSIAYVHQALRADADSTITSPQSTYSSRGESSRISADSRNAAYASGTVHLPYKVDLFTIMDAVSGQPYNITTGTDANGDGNFNDRPSYAAGADAGTYSTRFGLLTTNTINGNVPRNLGTMPSRIHIDTNLSRTFLLNPNDRDHPRTIVVNARSANLLNHTNATTVGTVISSSTFGQSLSAEAARRVELGARFTF